MQEKRNKILGFPGGSVVEDMRSIPCLGRSHLPGNPCVTTIDPVLQSLEATITEPLHPRAHVLQQESGPHFLQLKKNSHCNEATREYCLLFSTREGLHSNKDSEQQKINV